MAILAGEIVRASDLSLVTPWQAWTPVWSGITGGTGFTSSARYRIQDGLFVFKAGFKLGTGASIAGAIELAMPTGVVRALDTTTYIFGTVTGAAFGFDNSSGQRWGGGTAVGHPSDNSKLIYRIGGSEASTTGWGVGGPFTWAANDEFACSGTTEVAP